VFREHILQTQEHMRDIKQQLFNPQPPPQNISETYVFIFTSIELFHFRTDLTPNEWPI